MANQAEVTKLNQHILTGAADSAEVSKLVMYVLLQPGDSDGGTSNRQGHVYSQLIQRD